jgi:hypothetical protein
MCFFRDIHGIAALRFLPFRRMRGVQTVIQNRFPVKTGTLGAFAATTATVKIPNWISGLMSGGETTVGTSSRLLDPAGRRRVDRKLVATRAREAK